MRMMNTQINPADSSTILTTADWNVDSENTPVYAVVSAVAEAEGIDPVDLPPLYEAIDPEALNDLFTSCSTSSVGKVAFQYTGYDVVVCGSGEVEVQSTE